MTGEQREARCVWIVPPEEPNARMLIPGCMERVLDWDAACTCKTTALQLDEADDTIRRLRADLKRAHDDYHALAYAVGRHPDAKQILNAAQQLRLQWRRTSAEQAPPPDVPGGDPR